MTTTSTKTWIATAKTRSGRTVSYRFKHANGVPNYLIIIDYRVGGREEEAYGGYRTEAEAKTARNAVGARAAQGGAIAYIVPVKTITAAK